MRHSTKPPLGANDEELYEFENLADEFENQQTLEKYLELRQQFPSGDISLDRFSDLLTLTNVDDELHRHDIFYGDISRAAGGDASAMDRCAVSIIKALCIRRNIELTGKTHVTSRDLAISDELINFSLAIILESSARHQTALPTSVALLIREHYLGGPHTKRFQKHEARIDRAEAVWIGSEIKKSEKVPTFRGIAKKMGVAPSTVSRWFPGNELAIAIERHDNMWADRS